MNRIPIPEKGPIVILGSKGGAPLPVVPAATVISANAAAELGVIYREKYGSYLIAVLNGDNFRHNEHIKSAIKRSKPDAIIIMGGDQEDATLIKDELDLSSVPIECISRRQRHKLMKEILGRKSVWLAVRRLASLPLRYVLVRVLGDILFYKKYAWMSRSTGLNAILFALERFPGEEIVTAGIGLEAGDHFYGVDSFTEKTARVDRLTYDVWHPKGIPLKTTDNSLHELGGIPLWDGEVFYYKP